jgi:hypothetical protein
MSNDTPKTPGPVAAHVQGRVERFVASYCGQSIDVTDPAKLALSLHAPEPPQIRCPQCGGGIVTPHVETIQKRPRPVVMTFCGPRCAGDYQMGCE